MITSRSLNACFPFSPFFRMFETPRCRLQQQVNRSYGCYSFTNKAKSYKDATTYCQSMSPHSHLMFLDSAEKVRDLKDVLRK